MLVYRIFLIYFNWMLTFINEKKTKRKLKLKIKYRMLISVKFK